MSGLIVGLVLRAPITDKFNSEAKFIATVYADHAWEDGTHAYPAVETVANITGFSVRTVQRYLRVLEGIGVLRLAGKGPRGTNRYDFTLKNNEDGSVRLVFGRGDSLTPCQVVGGDIESGDRDSGDTSDTRINNPFINVVVNSEDLAKISKLYESEIGALTPLVADSIRDAVKEYSADWIEEAIQLAVENNSRRWNYVLAILKNCKASGKRPSLNKLEKKHATYKPTDKHTTNPAQQKQPTPADIAAAQRARAKKQAQSSSTDV